jgi:hypothetical protein
MSSTDVKDDAHVGHRSTSVKTDHTTSIGALIVIDARSTPPLAMIPSAGPVTLIHPGPMYQMVHAAKCFVKGGTYSWRSRAIVTAVNIVRSKFGDRDKDENSWRTRTDLRC